MAKYFSADFHFNDNRLELLGRPFDNTEDHNLTIINNINKVVKENDELICGGDAAYNEEGLKLVELINCKNITLTRGNYDRQFTDEQLSKYFKKIIPEGEGYSVDIEGLSEPVNVVHYPSCSKKDMFNLTGHTHGVWKVQKNMLSICVDPWHFRPISEKQIVFMMNAVYNFYDRDAFAAYLDQNHVHMGRGRHSSYFDLLKDKK